MIDLDLFHLEAMARALDYFACCSGAGERSECTPNHAATVRAEPVPRARSLVLASPGSLHAKRGFVLPSGLVGRPCLMAAAENGSSSTVLFSHW